MVILKNLLESGIWMNGHAANHKKRWPSSGYPPPFPGQHIFHDTPPATPPFFDHMCIRPELYIESSRNFYEPVDLPGWRKHKLVERQIRGTNPFGDFTWLVQSLYDLDSRAASTKIEDRCLDEIEVISGLILVCLGLEAVKVAMRSAKVLTNNTIEPEACSDIDLESKPWTVILLYFRNAGDAVGHWVASIWNEFSRELYVFDALEYSRDERRRRICKAWSSLLSTKGPIQRWAYVQPQMTPQTTWQCGYVAIMCVYNFFRRSEKEIPIIYPLTTRYPAADWGAEPTINSHDIQRLDLTMVATIRGWVYSFFGYPVNCPLNPWKPLRLSEKLMKEGIDKKWWHIHPLAEGRLYPTPTELECIIQHCKVRDRRGDSVVRGLRNRMDDGEPVWKKSELLKYWYIGNAADSAAHQYANGPWAYKHSPYSEGPRSLPRGPYQNLFSSTLAYTKSTSKQRTSHINEAEAREAAISRKEQLRASIGDEVKSFVPFKRQGHLPLVVPSAQTIQCDPKRPSRNEYASMTTTKIKDMQDPRREARLCGPHLPDPGRCVVTKAKVGLYAMSHILSFLHSRPNALDNSNPNPERKNR